MGKQKDGEFKLKFFKTANCDKKLKGVHPSLIQVPSFFIGLVGGMGSGKTTVSQNLMFNKEAYHKKFDNIFYLSPNSEPESLLEDNEVRRLDPNLFFDIFDGLKNDMAEGRTMLILDDCVTELKKKDFRNALIELVRNRRHYGDGLGIMLISQSLMAIPKDLRRLFDLLFLWRCNYDVRDVHEGMGINMDYLKYKSLLNQCWRSQHDFVLHNRHNGKLYRNFSEIDIENY